MMLSQLGDEAPREARDSALQHRLSLAWNGEFRSFHAFISSICLVAMPIGLSKAKRAPGFAAKPAPVIAPVQLSSLK